MATKVGRPKLDVIRDHTVTVRLSAEEHSRLKEYSEKHQKTVEFNASSRALVCLEQYGILASNEKEQSAKVLRAAALTYVAAAAASILQLLRLIMLFGGGRRRDD